MQAEGWSHEEAYAYNLLLTILGASDRDFSERIIGFGRTRLGRCAIQRVILTRIIVQDP